MNVFQYAAIEERVFEQNAKNVGYERKTTFYSDLSIAECYGIKSIKDTYNRVVKQWLDNHEYFTEFIMCLNWKSWEMYDRKNFDLSKLYADLFEKARNKAYKHYKNNKEVLEYMFNVLD